MKRAVLLEQLISSWIRLTAVLKNTRITQPHGMNYNEAIIMHILYTRYREDGVGLVSFKELAEETRMLKSLLAAGGVPRFRTCRPFLPRPAAILEHPGPRRLPRRT